MHARTRPGRLPVALGAIASVGMLCSGCPSGGQEAAKAPPTAAEVKAQTQQQQQAIQNDPNIPPQAKAAIMGAMQSGQQSGQQSGAGMAQTQKAQGGSK